MARIYNLLPLMGMLTAFAIPSAAQAGSPDGRIQIRLLGTLVAPDGKSKDIRSDFPGGDSRANNNVVPTATIEYFFSPQVSVETICCMTQHHVTGTGVLAGVELADKVLIVPSTFTMKYHLSLGPIKPYVGGGVSVFFFLKDKVGKDLVSAFDKLTIKDKVGGVLQAGADIPLNNKGMSLSFDAKRYFMRPTAHFYSNGVDTYDPRIKLDPWTFSVGVGYRFR